jgi:hypothetical protein
MQYMEHTQIYPILTKQQIVAYFRCVDDILIIYDEKKQIQYTHLMNLTKYNLL